VEDASLWLAASVLKSTAKYQIQGVILWFQDLFPLAASADIFTPL